MKRLALCLAFAACLSGCTINRALVASADRFANKTVGPEYEQYVKDDTKLTAAEKELRLQNVRSFRLAVEEAQR